jgi:two-component system, chemotaxis family, chemotaxis protein CheY
MAKKIFIVEDEFDLMEFYIDALETSGYEVVGYAANGAEAVEKFKKLEVRPDVIIMDHRMPLKSGVEATREILAIDPSARVIFASADKSVEPEARSLGISSFKTKPFSLERLINNIDKIPQK